MRELVRPSPPADWLRAFRHHAHEELPLNSDSERDFPKPTAEWVSAFCHRPEHESGGWRGESSPPSTGWLHGLTPQRYHPLSRHNGEVPVRSRRCYLCGIAVGVLGWIVLLVGAVLLAIFVFQHIARQSSAAKESEMTTKHISEEATSTSIPSKAKEASSSVSVHHVLLSSSLTSSTTRTARSTTRSSTTSTTLFVTSTSTTAAPDTSTSTLTTTVQIPTSSIATSSYNSDIGIKTSTAATTTIIPAITTDYNPWITTSAYPTTTAAMQIATLSLSTTTIWQDPHPMMHHFELEKMFGIRAEVSCFKDGCEVVANDNCQWARGVVNLTTLSNATYIEHLDLAGCQEYVVGNLQDLVNLTHLRYLELSSSQVAGCNELDTCLCSSKDACDILLGRPNQNAAVTR